MRAHTVCVAQSECFAMEMACATISQKCSINALRVQCWKQPIWKIWFLCWEVRCSEATLRLRDLNSALLNGLEMSIDSPSHFRSSLKIFFSFLANFVQTLLFVCIGGQTLTAYVIVCTYFHACQLMSYKFGDGNSKVQQDVINILIVSRHRH